MPQSFSSLHYHLVFSTKGREPWLAPSYHERLYAYIGGVIRAEEGALLDANGTADHLHLLATFDKTRSVSEMLRVIKSRSSGWIHETFPELSHFAWQAGYGAFSLSQSGLPGVREYLAGQEAHHRTVTFQQEFLEFLHRHEIPYDPRYIWD